MTNDNAFKKADELLAGTADKYRLSMEDLESLKLDIAQALVEASEECYP